MYAFRARAPTPVLIPTSLDGVELIIIIIGTFGQALSTNAQSSLGTINIYAVLIVWRFVVSSAFSARPRATLPPPY